MSPAPPPTQNFIGARLDSHLMWWAEEQGYDIRPAMELVRTYHTGQRLNGDFNINHPLTVAHIFTQIVDVCREGDIPPLPKGEVQAALRGLLCHDILEDTFCTRTQLASLIGERAERIVFGVSKKYHNEMGMLTRKPSAQILPDIVADPLSLVVKFLDRSHNLGTMVDIDGTSFVSKVVYSPEKQLQKMGEAIFELIPAGDVATVRKRYAPDYHPYVGVACAYLIQTVSDVFGQYAAADMRLTFEGWRNTEQQEKLLKAIRFPESGTTDLLNAFCRMAGVVTAVGHVGDMGHDGNRPRKRYPADALTPAG